MIEEFVDRRELARVLKVHVNTVDGWRKTPGFPQEKWGPRTVRFQPTRVLEFLRENA